MAKSVERYERRVGVLLPTSMYASGDVEPMGSRQIPAILNYSSVTSILLACARLAGLRQISPLELSSNAQTRSSAPPGRSIELLFFEDVRARITRPQRFFALLRQCARPIYQLLTITIN